MSKRVRSVSLSELRRIIREEADLLQGKDDPTDVSPDEMPWEDGEDVGKQDYVAQMDKPSPAVKAEARLRSLKLHASRLSRRLQETKKRIAAYQKFIVEAKARGKGRGRRQRRR